MKRIFMYLILVSLLMSCGTYQKTNIIESNDLVGLWGMVKELPSGKTVYIGTIKVINPDKTFYLIWNSGGKPYKDLSGKTNNKPFIGLYGTYKFGKKEGSFTNYTEHIISHSLSATLDNTDSELKYKMIDKNTMLLMYHIKSSGEVGREVWKRITPLN